VSAKRKSERDPMRLWAVMRANGTYVAAFALKDVAERTISDMPGYGVVEFIEVRQPPPRDTPWGEGQFDHVQVGPGVTIALRITPDGRVKMLSPGGEIDVTDGSSSLGTGLHEAGRRAAQIRVRREERARKRAEKAAKP
jgi:hypothetical protein